MSKEITDALLKKFAGEYENDPVQKAVRRALYRTKLNDAALVQENEGKVADRFSIDIKTLPVTNQRQSGRCWIFSALNTLREDTAKKLKLEKFEFSQNYVAFWDKLEKINFYMESVIELADKGWDDRTLDWINRWGVSDGGQWDMFTALVEKYGLVPKDAMPETASSNATRTINTLTNRRLRRFCADVKAAAGDKDDIEALKEDCLNELYRMQCSCFGVPPKKFDFEYVDKDNKYHCVKDLTPKAFFKKYVDWDFTDYASLIHSPTEDKPYYKRYTVKYLGNVVGKKVKHLNLPLDEFKKAVIDQLKDGKVVWFGSDCSPFGDRQGGFWAPESFDFDSLFNIDFSITKEDALNSRESAMNHAMVITGVNLDDGKPTKWKIENSWGDEIAHKGYFVASDEWFDRYVYQAVVNKKYLSNKAMKAMNTKLIELEPWDPMGTLAD
ncbi:MAG: C1 family peptidase [Erysipelotrichaceae bacterium]|nr:C1 family peptidase [Erysipelotrichaceae bacterium]MBR3167590.1 C1 family peptidase [Erysipelotrichaceae bacterium]